MIVCPLLVAGEVIGTLNMARMGGAESHFSRDEFELVQLFAAQASIALRNAEAHGAVITQAAHDALTGLRNHGAFQRELGEWIGRAGPFALLMVDLDAFKAYNDTHGHPAGDALLARIAQAMAERGPRRRPRLPLRRRRVRDPRAARRRGRCPGGRRSRPDGHRHPHRDLRTAGHRQRGHRRLPGPRHRQGRPRGRGRPRAVPGEAGDPDPRDGRRPDAGPLPRGRGRDHHQAAGAPRATASCCARSWSGPLRWWASGTGSCTCSRTTARATWTSSRGWASASSRRSRATTCRRAPASAGPWSGAAAPWSWTTTTSTRTGRTTSRGARSARCAPCR